MKVKSGQRFVFKLSVYALLCFVFYFVFQHSAVHDYIHAVKQPSSIAAQQNEQDVQHISEEELKLKIEQMAQSINKKPINATIDRVWKAIPGYNGLQLNVEKTLAKVRQSGVLKRDHLVIDQVSPDIMLDDLEPAPIYRGNAEKPMVSLMINVAWGTSYLPDMLHTLAEYDVAATFFLDGKWLQTHEELAQSIVDAGHEIGNHAYSHPDLRHMSQADIKTEIIRTEQLIARLGVKSRLFAPPAGAYDDRVVQLAHHLQMRTVLWTLDTVDWKNPPKQTIIDRIVPNLENGVLILMHPTEPTAAALPQLIQGIHERGLTIGTVSDLLSPARNL